MTTNQAAHAFREVPEQMWDRIAVMRAECPELSDRERRAKTIWIGRTFGFDEPELIQRGLIAEDAEFVPDPSASKGARRA